MSEKADINAIIEKVFDSFKKITPALLAGDIACAALLFAPASLRVAMGLDKFQNPWKLFVGILFIFLSSIILIIVLSYIFSPLFTKWKYKRQMQYLRKQLTELSPKHKAILQKLFKDKDRTIRLESVSGDTKYLVAKNIIFRPEQFLDVYSTDIHDMGRQTYYYCPQAWVVDIYEKEPLIFQAGENGK